MDYQLITKEEKQTKEEIQIERKEADIQRKEAKIEELRSKMEALDRSNEELYKMNFMSLDKDKDRLNEQIKDLNQQISLILGSAKPKDEVWEYICNLVDFQKLDFRNGDNDHRSSSLVHNNSTESNRIARHQKSDSFTPIYFCNFPSLSFDFREIWKVVQKNWLLDMGKDKLD